MKILAVGDMHLGRTPSRLPPELAARANALGPAEAWRRTVKKALETSVRAVLLAGDVVEREDDFFEAYRELSGGVERLAEQGVEVIGVAGNHDVRVLPRLARQTDGFRLLGSDDQWQCHPIVADNETINLWGWSFPEEKVFASPLPQAPFARKPGINIGLLHCDRDGGASPYAPVSSTELDRAGLDAWLLGHIHKPDKLTADAPSGYLGSLTGMDPGEPGQRGPWLITIARGRLASVEQVPLAPLRWETLVVDLGAISEPAEAKDRLLAAVRSLDETIAATSSQADAIGLRVIFAGRTRFGAEAASAISPDDRENVYRGPRNRHYFIETLRTETRPEIDLAKLAERPDPPGLLAQRLLWLEEPEGHTERDRLAALARQRFESIAGNAIWHEVREETLGALEPVERLREAGFRALERLLAQSSDSV